MKPVLLFVFFQFLATNIIAQIKANFSPGDFIVTKESNILYKVISQKKKKLKVSYLVDTRERKNTVMDLKKSTAEIFKPKKRDSLISVDNIKYKIYWIFEDKPDKYFGVNSQKGGLTWPETKSLSFLEEVKEAIILRETPEEIKAEADYQAALNAPVNFNIDEGLIGILNQTRLWQLDTYLYRKIKDIIENKKEDATLPLFLDKFDRAQGNSRCSIVFEMEEESNRFMLGYANPIMTPHRDEKFIKGNIFQLENGNYRVTVQPNKIKRRIYFDMKINEPINYVPGGSISLKLFNFRSE